MEIVTRQYLIFGQEKKLEIGFVVSVWLYVVIYVMFRYGYSQNRAK